MRTPSPRAEVQSRSSRRWAEAQPRVGGGVGRSLPLSLPAEGSGCWRAAGVRAGGVVRATSRAGRTLRGGSAPLGSVYSRPRRRKQSQCQCPAPSGNEACHLCPTGRGAPGRVRTGTRGPPCRMGTGCQSRVSYSGTPHRLGFRGPEAARRLGGVFCPRVHACT